MHFTSAPSRERNVDTTRFLNRSQPRLKVGKLLHSNSKPQQHANQQPARGRTHAQYAYESITEDCEVRLAVRSAWWAIGERCPTCEAAVTAAAVGAMVSSDEPPGMGTAPEMRISLGRFFFARCEIGSWTCVRACMRVCVTKLAMAADLSSAGKELPPRKNYSARPVSEMPPARRGREAEPDWRDERPRCQIRASATQP